MDPNHSLHYSSSSSPLAHGHSFMIMPPPAIPHHSQSLHEFGGGSANSRLSTMELQRQHLQLFWQQQMLEVDQIAEFKQHQLPLARIKRIMKSDEDVKMISADAPILFSKACELFILELTLRSWMHTEDKKRRTLQKSDIAYAISHGEVLDFLLDVVPMDEMKEEEEVGGNWVRTESFPNNGMHFPLVNANPFNQAFDEEFMSRQQEIPQQFMIQQPMCTSTHSFYQPHQ